MAAHEPLLILDATQISQRINRLAYQIYEQNFDEKSLVIVGIADRGYQVAKKVYEKLKEIAPFELELCELTINKQQVSTKDIQLNPTISNLSDKAVVLCDDVLYTGKTLAYATVPFLEAGVKKLQCLVLIQRNYVNFPVHPTYVGMSLASTLQEHVNVNLTGEETVYLQ
jgi:pyrimidine operon attenuation protein/uracil phosphoribosyltransferase